MEKKVNETEIRHGRHAYRLTIALLSGGREGRSLALRPDAARDASLREAVAGLARVRPAPKPWQRELLRLGSVLSQRENLVQDLTALFGPGGTEAALAEAWRRTTTPETDGSAAESAFLHALGLFDELPVALTLRRLARLETRGVMPMVMTHRVTDARVTRDAGNGSVRVTKDNWETSVLWQTGRRMPVGLFVIENEGDAPDRPTTPETHPLDQFFYWDHRWRELGLPRSAPMIWITPPAGLTPQTLEPCARFRFSFTLPNEFVANFPSADPIERAVREVTVRSGGRERKFLSHRVPEGRVVTNCVRSTGDALALDKMRRKTEALWDAAFARSGAPQDLARPWIGTQTDAMLRGRLFLGFLTLLLSEALFEVLRRIEREGSAESSSLLDAVRLAALPELDDETAALAQSALASVFEVLEPKEREEVEPASATKPAIESAETPASEGVAPTPVPAPVATPAKAPDLFGDELLLFPEPPEAHPTTREWRRRTRPKNSSLQGVLFSLDD